MFTTNKPGLFRQFFFNDLSKHLVTFFFYNKSIVHICFISIIIEITRLFLIIYCWPMLLVYITFFRICYSKFCIGRHFTFLRKRFKKFLQRRRSPLTIIGATEESDQTPVTDDHRGSQCIDVVLTVFTSRIRFRWSSLRQTYQSCVDALPHLVEVNYSFGSYRLGLWSSY